LEEGRVYTDQWVDDYLKLTLMGWCVMIVVCYVALAIRLAAWTAAVRSYDDAAARILNRCRPGPAGRRLLEAVDARKKTSEAAPKTQ
jgi:hypothetical protein